mgnify:CR=1 FL=1
MANIIATDHDDAAGKDARNGRICGSNAGDTFGGGTGFDRIFGDQIAPEVSEIFPKLTALTARNGYRAARLSLKRHEGCVLISV